MLSSCPIREFPHQVRLDLVPASGLLEQFCGISIRLTVHILATER